MQTRFSPAQLDQPHIQEADRILRACVHCGFCLATCPTYVVQGDENDSPRGRIYLIKHMLESAAPPSAATIRHTDRCLSCLACETTCPSGVAFGRLVDHARLTIEESGARGWRERFFRAFLAALLPHPRRLRLALGVARFIRPFTRPFSRWLPERLSGRLVNLLDLTPPPEVHYKAVSPGVHPTQGEKKGRVILAPGCVQQAMAPRVDAAAIRLLTRLGIEVVVPEGGGCCGALDHHLGREAPALAAARNTMAAWNHIMESAPTENAVDAVVSTVSGCGAHMRDYGYLLRDDPEHLAAARVAGKVSDISEFVAGIGLQDVAAPLPLVVAYHHACTLQHGNVQHGEETGQAPVALLKEVGFEVREPAESHLCCGSAGVYNMLQPELAEALGARKAENLARLEAQVVVAGNLGCMVQISAHVSGPVVHTIELLDWAGGGPVPVPLESLVAGLSPPSLSSTGD